MANEDKAKYSCTISGYIDIREFYQAAEALQALGANARGLTKSGLLAEIVSEYVRIMQENDLISEEARGKNLTESIDALSREFGINVGSNKREREQLKEGLKEEQGSRAGLKITPQGSSENEGGQQRKESQGSGQSEQEQPGLGRWVDEDTFLPWEDLENWTKRNIMEVKDEHGEEAALALPTDYKLMKSGGRSVTRQSLDGLSEEEQMERALSAGHPSVRDDSSPGDFSAPSEQADG